MSNQITMRDLDVQLDRYVANLTALGIAYDGHIGIQHGSKINGIAFRLYHTGYPVPDGNGGQRPTTGHANPPVGSDFLGMTKREAWEALIAINTVLSDVAWRIGQKA